MNQQVEEVPITQRVAERPGFQADRVKQVKPRMLAIRFLAGGLTSVVAGLVTLAFGARVGGVFLAFPAILAASLTLIKQQNDSAEAREDARGAVLGGGAMAAFAAIGAIGFGHLSGGLVLLLATAGWALVAVAGYLVAWFR
jgi:hypothetical protein